MENRTVAASRPAGVGLQCSISCLSQSLCLGCHFLMHLNKLLVGRRGKQIKDTWGISLYFLQMLFNLSFSQITSLFLKVTIKITDTQCKLLGVQNAKITHVSKSLPGPGIRNAKGRVREPKPKLKGCRKG